MPPSLIALLLQLFSFAIVLSLLHLTSLHPHPLVSALLCGALAALFSKLAGLARWWLFIQFLFLPALLLMLGLAIPSGFYLVAFLILLAVYWSSFRSQVPLYLSSSKVWKELEGLLQAQQPGFRFIDLGCGLGGVLGHLARARPDGNFTGVESAPLPLLWSRLRTLGLRNCKLRWGSLWGCDLSQYDVVYAYLSPVPMPALWDKARKEMRPGSLFVSSTFEVPGETPHQTIQVDDLHHSILRIWRM